MKRLLATTLADIRLQFRNGFYTVSVIVAVVFVLVLSQFPQVDWGYWWPAILLENLLINTFYFMAGMVLLEKGEGTLEAQIVTPLRPWEYLSAKLLSLSLLSIVESLILVVLLSGIIFNWLFLLAGLMILVALYALYGFFVVVRYDSIGEFLLPSAIWTLGLSLPLLDYFDLWNHWLMFLHPFQAPLVLMKAAWQPVEAWQILYGLGYGAIWVLIGYWLAQRAFRQFVVLKQGVRG